MIARAEVELLVRAAQLLRRFGETGVAEELFTRAEAVDADSISRRDGE